jgi:hypothetical protein
VKIVNTKGGAALKLKPNINELKRLVDESFNGNKSAFANAIGVDRGQVSKVLKDGSCAGSLFFGGLMSFCERENLDFNRYIIFPNDVKKVNNATGTDG